MIHKRNYNLNLELISACEGGNLDIVKLMIENGADDWDSGLYHACFK